MDIITRYAARLTRALAPLPTFHSGHISLLQARQPQFVIRIGVAEHTEKCIIQSNCFNIPHIWVIQELRVNVEEDGHVYRLSSVQTLLFKAKALYLAEVRRNLTRSNAVRGDANDVGVRLVRRRVECQSRFAGDHTDFALLRCEFPREYV